MRHQVFGRKLNKDIKERRALYKNLLLALITHGKIRTTYARAKAIVGLADKLVTHAKVGSVSAIRQISSILNQKESINQLVRKIAPQFKDKMGGYTRIIKVGKRQGDSAEEVFLEWSNSGKKEISTKLPPKNKA